ncbi:SDR family oxidoreductase [Larsenimonas rhizosphaerae]|uniref:SDR family oxidoreductase n=1 Tax=Larsenimonas rhizosphaerae TaxID=2944682 RepID=A0AA42CYQ5_9GAMM|nr:SDR family oxidoreductase [Larsenimonas rhizosphaerae]MCM2131231.1 SDR family oxidoreductase [Larsenimonas rhizosphaerae]MCX2525410.1 SDR family oxidoreductase [Larsenimonas rhizosphaerae]
MNNTTLILGCGDVGTLLGQQLIAQGQRVIGVRRHPEKLEGSGIEPLAMNLDDDEAVAALPDADIVIYILSADRFEESAYESAYYQGLDRVLTTFEARAEPPKQVIFVSSTSVYGQCDGETVTEDSVIVPTGFAGKWLHKAESRLWQSSIPGTSVRFSGIYGPGRERLINQVQEGRVAPATPPMYSNRIHRDDCAGVLVFLIEKALAGDTLDPVYLGSDQEAAPIHDVMMWLSRALGIEPSNTIQSPLRRRASKRCDSTRLQMAGYTFMFPTFREGYRDVLREAGLPCRVD